MTPAPDEADELPWPADRARSGGKRVACSTSMMPMQYSLRRSGRREQKQARCVRRSRRDVEQAGWLDIRSVIGYSHPTDRPRRALWRLDLPPDSIC
jgi:hypothetical protein